MCNYYSVAIKVGVSLMLYQEFIDMDVLRLLIWLYYIKGALDVNCDVDMLVIFVTTFGIVEGGKMYYFKKGI